MKREYPIFRVRHHEEGGGCYDSYRAEIFGEDRDTHQKAEDDLRQMKLRIMFDINAAVEKRLKELGWVKLKPHQVVADKIVKVRPSLSCYVHCPGEYDLREAEQ